MKTENDSTPKWYETLTFKMALLGFMAIMFIVPLQMIMMMIRERESSSEDVRQEIAAQWGESQIVSGPVLNIPVYRKMESGDGDLRREMVTWHIMPDNLTVDGLVVPQIRYKGIYESVIYDADLSINGKFDLNSSDYTEKYEVLWDEAYFVLGVSDNRGLKDQISMIINGNRIDAEPGLEDHDLFSSGISFPVKIDPGEEVFTFSADFGLRGSSGIYFSPVGKSTSVTLVSDWDAPSFSGNFLPQTRDVDENGFSAGWMITNLNRNFPQEWVGAGYSPADESFGVELILEADHYQKSERSVKYGMLFIAFTFLALLFIELSSKKRIHIFSYFLVSLALVLFFSLLTSLSEHIGFNPAYLISATATIGLVSLFTGSILKKKSTAVIVGALLIILYLFIFILLALKEYSYLAGNIGLFVALAAIMRFTSKTDLFRKDPV